ncbi:MAG TPA: dihydrolipoamide acetyltransferase family protein [Pseudonocardia sp.]|jgi:pyruvate dehydrogenase E2 component (dihydrolipoamide acetyltransferase)|nr:dihydrolipoamide acetyltransferase family protein [Pseudonocardia sp.]
MSAQVFALPDVGEGLTEAEILSWQVAVGDVVTVNQVIVEIETAKAAVELPSPYAGTVLELLVEPGATIDVGTPIIKIGDPSDAGGPPPEKAEPPASGDASREPAAGTAGESAGAKIGEAGVDGRIATLVGYGPRPGSVTRRPRKSASVGATDAASPDSQPAVVEAVAQVAGLSAAALSVGEASERRGTGTVPLAKPPVRKLAKEQGIDLRSLAGSGPGGVITRDDLAAAAGSLESNGAVAGPASASSGTAARPTGLVGGHPGGERREPIRGVRKATAAAMVSSAFTAPHVTEFLTVDVTPMIELRDRLRTNRAFADVKLTALVFAAKAVCLAARRTPEINAHWDGKNQEIVYFDRVQLGIAAATPRGLVVPKIRDADTLGLRELAEAIGELTATARAGKTTPADMAGGTFTITNVGVFGVDTGTPILNPGEAGILALGAVKQAPWVVDGQLAVRTVCQLALSFDHRLVDGEQGSRFLADVGALLADPGLALTY